MSEYTENRKKRFFLNHKKSSALVVSVILHAVFIVVAVVFVAVSVYVKPEQTFEVKDVNRPKMQLRKLQVPVKDQKKTQAPKLRQNIVAKPKLKDIAIKMPEVVGVPGGTYGSGEGLGGLGFGLDMDLFGSSRGTGNEFIGTFYDLKQTPDGKLTDIGERAAADPFHRDNQLFACKLIKNFVGSGFNEGRLKGFFKAPKLKYGTVFMMPPMSAGAAPAAFDVDDQVQPSYWICHYKGQIAAPEDGRYRFCGIGDDILIVRVGRKVVLDASWPELIGVVSSWKSNDDNSRKFPLNGDVYGGVNGPPFLEVFKQMERAGGFNGNMIYGAAIRTVPDFDFGHHNYMSIASRMVIGDWITLRKGQIVDMDVLIGEIPGGDFMARLLIEQEGVQYRMVDSDAGPRPVLPVFKTTPIDENLTSQMRLNSNEATLEGPVFGAAINGVKKGPGLGF